MKAFQSLSQEQYDALVRDAMRWRASGADLLREAKGLLEALEMEGADSQEFFDWRNGLLAAIEKAEPRL